MSTTRTPNKRTPTQAQDRQTHALEYLRTLCTEGTRLYALRTYFNPYTTATRYRFFVAMQRECGHAEIICITGPLANATQTSVKDCRQNWQIRTNNPQAVIERLSTLLHGVYNALLTDTQTM